MRTQRPSLHVFHVLLAVIALAVATGGCSGRPLITRVPEMTPAATRTASPEPTATFTPLPPQPPRMLGRSPARGEEQPPDAALELRFDQPMATSTVEEAITIEPAVPGSFTWDAAGTVLRFQPTDDGWDRDATYRVTVSTDAESAAGLSLEDVITFEFRTVVSRGRMPSPPTADVALDAAIRVVFNRPWCPHGIAQQDRLPRPIVFAPSIQGEGTWTNTSIYTFQPRCASPARNPLHRLHSVRAQGHHQRHPSGELHLGFVTAACGGARLAGGGCAQCSPKAGVITFNQAMDARSTQERFALVPLGSKTSVLGRFSWLDDTTMVYTPTQPLEEDALHEAVLEEGALALSGEAATDEELRWEFTVAPLPEVVSTSPRNNATDVELYDGLKITFSSPISPTTFEEHLTIAPATELYTYWSNDDTVAHVSAFLKPSTAIQ